MRDFIGVGKREGGRVPGQERKVRIVRYGKYRYPARSKAGSNGGTGADQYDVMKLGCLKRRDKNSPPLVLINHGPTVYIFSVVF